MKIGIDARGINFYKGTGIGTYTENLLRCLLNIDRDNYYHIYWWGENHNEFKKNNSKITFTSKKNKNFFENHYFSNSISTEGIDLYHVPQNGIGLHQDIACKKIITIHDLIPYVMPETVGKGYLNKFLKELPTLIDNCNAILTVSEWSKKDITRFFPKFDPEKIFVTPLAADSKYRPMDKDKCKYVLKKFYNITKPFILYIGGFSPRKNVHSLITAFSKVFNKLNEEYELVIVGANKDNGESLLNMSTNMNIKDRIVFTGFIPESHLPLFYNGCDLFVYPSLYEGFGLPPLEAMSCGTPVISSNLSSIPEVVKDGGILIDPYDEKLLEIMIEKTLGDITFQNSLKEKAIKRASLFSWTETARRTLDAYNKTCNDI
ncbi:glycosyltransferase family 4 protein [Clostridium sp. MSJ-11]|uniref:Glycosyltransferase family 4 protein n=1 Tax=Clostridium mobile TaxID=2841512 RepID=A0ABS6ELR4_9CLOT|nr:glycosyltransferase family 1 protein [Clostridium mobile]MBU5486165.1 glycosyltransferase family 4 protein [Clostridium mobile]